MAMCILLNLYSNVKIIQNPKMKYRDRRDFSLISEECIWHCSRLIIRNMHINRKIPAITGNDQTERKPQYLVVGAILEIYLLMQITFVIPRKLAIK